MTPRMKELMSVRNNMTIHDLDYLSRIEVANNSIMNSGIITKFSKRAWETNAIIQDAIINKYLIQD